jgi:3'(2'), 5'-bisphosphate nucleotidase
VSVEVTDQRLLQEASALARSAAETIRSFLHKPLNRKSKADRSPVTAADLAADRLIRKGLSRAFPEHGILTEETGYQKGKDKDWIWVVDPLDGTKAFAKGIPGFCVMIGLLKLGRPYLGVVVDPLEGHEYQALRGKGAFHLLSGKKTRLKVSDRSDFKEMPLVVSTGFPDPKLERAKKELGCPVLPPINSVGIKVGLLVRQLGDIYLNQHGVHYLDTCAPQVILEEAGGIMTLLNGRPLRYDFSAPVSPPMAHPMPTLATNGTRHRDLVEYCKRAGLV